MKLFYGLIRMNESCKLWAHVITCFKQVSGVITCFAFAISLFSALTFPYLWHANDTPFLFLMSRDEFLHTVKIIYLLCEITSTKCTSNGFFFMYNSKEWRFWQSLMACLVLMSWFQRDHICVMEDSTVVSAFACVYFIIFWLSVLCS